MPGRLGVLSQLFRPSAPIDEAELFAGRQDQVRDILLAVRQPGQHVVVFGERGVGKTSLANVISQRLEATESVLAPRVTCEGGDDYSSIWRHAFEEVALSAERKSVGFNSGTQFELQRLSEILPNADDIAANDVRKLLTMAGDEHLLLVIIDEFDRIDGRWSRKFADTIKMLSDHNVPATLILVGVADTVGALLDGHESVERALVQIAMPRMSIEELEEIVTQALSRADMSIAPQALTLVVTLSQGLPHYTHLLGLHAAIAADDDARTEVTMRDVEAAIRIGVAKAQESIKQTHYSATLSQRRDALYEDVLLACALAQPDDRGFFAASDVRAPMTRIMGRLYDIPAFAKHLNEFCDSRGPLLERIGERRRYKFRFRNPLMQPYVLMRGLERGRILLDDFTS